MKGPLGKTIPPFSSAGVRLKQAAGPRSSKLRTVVVFYHARTWVPLRSSNVSHLLCWRRHSRHRVVYVNVAFEVPWGLLRELTIDVVIFDTLFLAMHWDPAYFTARSIQCLAVKDLNCRKIAITQDEFFHMNIVNEFLRDIGITDVLTCSRPADWPTIYPLLDPRKTRFRTILTGYVDERRLAYIRAQKQPVRDIDIGYRAWNNSYWLGERGTSKVAIGVKIGKAARQYGLRVDIDNPAQYLIGEKWFDFLRRCRTVLGVEGGASVFDYDGSIKRKVEAYVSENPSASFEETRAACFPEDDHRINIACLSPRHFEAAMTRTCQVLLLGEYNDILQPWLHYIPVESDYSNIDDVLKAVTNQDLVKRIADRAYEDLVASGRWTYAAFVRDIEVSIIEAVPARAREHAPIIETIAFSLLYAWERLVWYYVHLEVSKKKIRICELNVLHWFHRWYNKGGARLRQVRRWLFQLPTPMV
jgi:hypothetical protein